MTAKRTPLYHAFLARNAQMAEKAHFLTANTFSDAKTEHVAVRTAAGLFEIFGQFLVEIAGANAKQFLNETLVADFTKVPVGGGVYCGILNETGGFIDDVITYRPAEDLFWLVPAPHRVAHRGAAPGPGHCRRAAPAGAACRSTATVARSTTTG